MKKQLVVIGGGNVYDSYEEYIQALKDTPVSIERIMSVGWKDSLANALPQWQVIQPEMPNGWNARYLEWEIIFEKIMEQLEGEIALVGHSLGGIFLAKYLSKHQSQNNIVALHLVAPPYDDESLESLGDFKITDSLAPVSQKIPNIFLYFSTDDPIVPFVELEKYVRAFPQAHVAQYTDRGHFWQAEFPEIVNNINLS